MTTCSSKRRKEPEVIVFEEPDWSIDRARKRKKKRGEDDNDSQKRIARGKRSKLEERKKTLEAEGLDFKQTMREVQFMVSSSLEGREKRKFEDQVVRNLGGIGRKPDRLPYPVYQEVVKRRKEKEKIEKEMSQAMGMPLKKKKETKIRGNGWWQERVKSLEPFAAGKFTDGALKLSERDLRRFKRR